MAQKRTFPGISKVLFCSYGTLKDVTPTWCVALGLRKPGSFVFEDVDMTKDYKERDLRNKMKGSSSDFESYQSDMDTLRRVFGIHAANPGVDCQIVLPETHTSGYNRVLNFGANEAQDVDRSLGFTPEFLLTDKERSLKMPVAANFSMDEYALILSTARTDRPENYPHAVWATVGDENLNLRRVPNNLSITGMDSGGAPISLFDRALVSSYKFSLKGVGEGNGRAANQNDYVDVSLELVSKHAEIEKWESLATLDYTTGFIMRQQTPQGVEVFKLNYGAGAFTVKNGRGDGNGKTNTALTWKVRVPLNKLNFTIPGTYPNEASLVISK